MILPWSRLFHGDTPRMVRMTGGLHFSLFVYSTFSTKNENSSVLNNNHGSSSKQTHKTKTFLVSPGKGTSVTRHTGYREESTDTFLIACNVGQHPWDPQPLWWLKRWPRGQIDQGWNSDLAPYQLCVLVTA